MITFLEKKHLCTSEFEMENKEQEKKIMDDYLPLLEVFEGYIHCILNLG
jgi:hypothetical protein